MISASKIKLVRSSIAIKPIAIASFYLAIELTTIVRLTLFLKIKFIAIQSTAIAIIAIMLNF